MHRVESPLDRFLSNNDDNDNVDCVHNKNYGNNYYRYFQRPHYYYFEEITLAFRIPLTMTELIIAMT